jgi:predicted MFS family arabinose efflux permease
MDESNGVSASPQAANARRHRLRIVAYVLVVVLFWASLYLYVPTLPNYVQGKSATLAQVGVILAQYGLWQAIIRLPLGITADWVGRRKPFIIAGLVLAGLGAWLLGTAESADALLVGRAVTGLAAANWVVILVAFTALFPAGQAVRATAILTTAASASRMVATSATGSLNNIGGYSLAFMLAAAIAGLGLLIAVPLPGQARRPRRPSVGGIGRLITRRDVLVPALLAAVAQYAMYAIPFGFMPILAEQLQASDVALSMLVSLHIGLSMVGSFAAALAVERIGARKLVVVCFAAMSAGIGLAALAQALPALFAAQVCIGLAHGVSYPVLMGLSIRDVGEEQRATAMGLNQSVYAVGMFAGPWLSGMLADAVGLRPMFGVTACACLAVSLFLVRLLPQRQTGGQDLPA